MGLSDLTDRNAVIEAIAECDRLGREAFREQYGFGQSTTYVLVHGGREYDSKAIAGVAHGIQHPELGTLDRREFSGGKDAAAKRLEELGFAVRFKQNPPWSYEELVNRPGFVGGS